MCGIDLLKKKYLSFILSFFSICEKDLFDPSFQILEKSKIGLFKKIQLNFLDARPVEHNLHLFPRSLLTLFVRSVQSHFFNIGLTERIASLEAQNKKINEGLEVGETICHHSNKNIFVTITPMNINYFEKKINAFEFVRCIKLISKKYVPTNAFEKKMLENEEFYAVLSLLHKKENQMFNIREEYRPIIEQYKDLQIKKSGSQILFTFELNKGVYATSLLREFLKKKKL